MHIFHNWEYLDSEHRICSTCGKCQLLYQPPPGWDPGDEGVPAHWEKPRRPYWKTCLADELEHHMKKRKREVEDEEKERIEQLNAQMEEKKKMDASRARAFELLKEKGSTQRD